MKLPWSSIVLATCVALAPTAAWAQGAPAAKPPQEKDEPATVKLVLHPAAEPRPAMKYLLYPPLADRRPGNAAVLYGKVLAARPETSGKGDLSEKIAQWIETPLDKLPKAEMQKWLQEARVSFRFLDLAARCESADWDLPIREEEFITILLPELQHMRTFGRMLAAKARLEMAEGDLEGAIHDLQSGYATARHASEAPTLIHALVGVAISNQMSKQVETLIQQPGAPNLYWALSHLPEPLVDIRRGLEAEWSLLYLSYPELRDLDKKDLSPEEWQRTLDRFLGHFQTWTDGRHAVAPPLQPLATAGLAVWAYPRAKQGMLARGYTPAQVDAMPVAQVVLLDTMLTYNEFRDETFKWFAVPWPQAQKGLAQADQRLRQAKYQGAIPLAQVRLPAISNAYRAQAKHERTIAALRIVEAIRLYGASHDARLPDKLDDIAEVPIPMDPTTGKPFLYRRTGDTAVLESPGGKAQGMRYELTFAPKGK